MDELGVLEPLLGVRDVMRILNVPRSSAYELMCSGRMRVVRMGSRVRVSPAALREFVAANEVDGVRIANAAWDARR